MKGKAPPSSQVWLHSALQAFSAAVLAPSRARITAVRSPKYLSPGHKCVFSPSLKFKTRLNPDSIGRSLALHSKSCDVYGAPGESLMGSGPYSG